MLIIFLQLIWSQFVLSSDSNKNVVDSIIVNRMCFDIIFYLINLITNLF